MEHYLEIRVLPDPEFTSNLLINALFAKLHRALVEDGTGEIGISFPLVGKCLGDIIRLHGDQTALQRLMAFGWLKGLTDYTNVTGVLPIPQNCRYRVVRRLQAKSSAERLYRRSVRKGWLTTDEVGEKIKMVKEQHLKQPFVQLKSKSTGQMFRLFIHHDKILVEPTPGIFSHYGLSADATIPWF